jgi:hypothetical protein
VKNILGLNQIRLLPEYNSHQISNNNKSHPCTIVSTSSTEKRSSNELILESISKLITKNIIDIKNFCIQFRQNWENFDDNVVLTILNSKTKEEIPLILIDLIKDKISLFAPLVKNMEWKKYGYRYFNPSDRAYFASVFKESYLANNEEQTFNCISQMVN